MKEQILAVQRMQDYIETHLDEKIGLSELSQVSLFSPWYSYRIFQEYTGMTPAHYIRRFRLAKAALRLKNEKDRIIDTAFDLGFGSVDGFTRAFNREFGMCPSDYSAEPVPITLFVPYGVKFRALRKDQNSMKKTNNIFIHVIHKPARKVLCKRGIKAEDYFNLVVTDPPYNVNYEGSAGKIKNDNMANDKFYQFLLDAYTCMNKAMADDASIYVFHADTEGLNFRKAFADAGFYLSGTCIWKKQSLVLGRSPYQWQHEPCLFGWKQKGKHQWYSGRKETTIWEFDKPKKNGDHPTMKPIPLIAYPIKNSSMTNCIVLDPFGGSGSTLIACEQTGRICRTIELDEKFCDSS